MWDKNFEIGDQVRVIDDNTVGIVVRRDGNHVWIATESGFDEQYLQHQLIKHDGLHIPDEFISQTPTPRPVKRINISKGKKKQNTPVIDLHFGHLEGYNKSLPKNKILPLQLSEAMKACENILASGGDRIILIHGKGEGKLETELKKLLDERGWKHYDADFTLYKLGATEIELR